MIDKNELLEELKKLGYEIEKEDVYRFQFKNKAILLFDGEFVTLRLWRDNNYISYIFTKIIIDEYGYGIFLINGILSGVAKL